MSAQVAQDLRAAAEVLRRDGWTTGEYHCRDGQGHCAEGAIDAATGFWIDVGQYDRARIERDFAAVFAFEGFIESDVVSWNDAPGRTADEVIAALLAAADAADAAEADQ